MYRHTDGWAGVMLNAPASVMAGRGGGVKSTLLHPAEIRFMRRQALLCFLSIIIACLTALNANVISIFPLHLCKTYIL